MTTQGSVPPKAPDVSETPNAAADTPSYGTTGFAADTGADTLRESARRYITKVRGGDPGALPALLGLVVLFIAFGFTTHRFFTVGNLANVPGQAGPTIVIAMGLVFVLLVGEIDLSAGTAAGACSAAMAVALNHNGNIDKVVHGGIYGAYVTMMVIGVAVTIWQRMWFAAAAASLGTALLVTSSAGNQVLALLLCITTGTVIGVLTGTMVARVGIPSFVVTLALFLGWQGVVLLFQGSSDGIPTRRFSLIAGFEGKNLAPVWGWVVFGVFVGLYAFVTLFRSIRRSAQGLSSEPMALVVLRIAILTVVGAASVYFLNQDRQPGKAVFRGMPRVIPVILGLLVIFSLLLTKTAFGRYLYAVGGNAEAARRAGINVPRIRISAFAICSSLAAFGGVLLASYSGGVNSAAGGGNTLLYAVGAAVIGGTSLFGGRGRVRDAILGGLVIQLIPNGLGLHPNLNAAYVYVITGGFLILAASVDAASRKRNAT